MVGVGWWCFLDLQNGQVMGLFGSSAKVSSAQSTAASGLGAFAPTNNIAISNSFFELETPGQIAGALVIVAAGLWAWRKLRV